MPDHVSPDTGRRLREAGLYHEWQQGDWMVTPDEPGPVLVVDVDEGEPVTKHYSYVLYDCTWLPSTGQLLEAIFGLQPEGEGCATVIRCSDSTYRVAVAVESPRGMFRYSIMGTSPAEALAEAWLRLRAQEVQP